MTREQRGVRIDQGQTVTVVGALLEIGGKILIARRKKGMPMEGLWEFPGGKLERGETHEACLKRELKEELNIEAEIGELIGSGRHGYKHGSIIELLVYRAFYVSGEFRLIDHDELRWVSPSDLGSYDFPEADRPVIEKIMENP
jgi:8-oxo-dGTP diphosphatase